jgi:hypothetical protein
MPAQAYAGGDGAFAARSAPLRIPLSLQESFLFRLFYGLFSSQNPFEVSAASGLPARPKLQPNPLKSGFL